jgi:hypothetical protein
MAVSSRETLFRMSQCLIWASFIVRLNPDNGVELTIVRLKVLEINEML